MDKITKRVELWLLLGIIGVLADEYIKEGYLFHVSDLFKPLTHESIIGFLAIVLAVVVSWRRSRKSNPLASRWALGISA